MPPGRQGMHTLSLDLFPSSQLQNQPHGSNRLMYTDLKSKHGMCHWRSGKHTQRAHAGLYASRSTKEEAQNKMETMCRVTDTEGQQNSSAVITNGTLQSAGQVTQPYVLLFACALRCRCLMAQQRHADEVEGQVGSDCVASLCSHPPRVPGMTEPAVCQRSLHRSAHNGYRVQLMQWMNKQDRLYIDRHNLSKLFGDCAESCAPQPAGLLENLFHDRAGCRQARMGTAKVAA